MNHDEDHVQIQKYQNVKPDSDLKMEFSKVPAFPLSNSPYWPVSLLVVSPYEDRE